MKKDIYNIKANLIYILIALIISIFIYRDIPIKQPAITATVVDPGTQESLNILIETNKYLISIAFIVIGVIGGSVIKDSENFKKGVLFITLFLISNIFAIVSLVYGYLLYNEIIDVFSNSISTINTERIIYLRKKQFLCLIVSVITFSWYIFNIFLSKIKTEQK